MAQSDDLPPGTFKVPPYREARASDRQDLEPSPDAPTSLRDEFTSQLSSDAGRAYGALLAVADVLEHYQTRLAMLERKVAMLEHKVG